MKRKMSKKVLCLCMVAVLAIGLAIPTFATETVQPRDFSGFYSDSRNLRPIYIYTGSRYLNIAGSQAVRGYNVTTYKSTSDTTQKWYLYVADDNVTTVRPVGDRMQAIYMDITNNSNCILENINATTVDYMSLYTPGSQYSYLRVKRGGEPKLTLGNAINSSTNYYKLYWTAANISNNIQWNYTLV